MRRIPSRSFWDWEPSRLSTQTTVFLRLRSCTETTTLSAIVASLTGARSLILLSDINGLYTDNPNTNPEAEFVPFVDTLDEELMGMGKDAVSSVGTGGILPS